MRILLFVLFIGTFLSCKKNKSSISNTLLGKWQFEYAVTSEHDTIKVSSGKVVTLMLSTDSTYTLSLNSSISSAGTFSTIKDGDIDALKFSKNMEADHLNLYLYQAYYYNAKYLIVYNPDPPTIEGAISFYRFVRVP